VRMRVRGQVVEQLSNIDAILVETVEQPMFA
jgi:hypothetical protein